MLKGFLYQDVLICTTIPNYNRLIGAFWGRGRPPVPPPLSGSSSRLRPSRLPNAKSVLYQNILICTTTPNYNRLIGVFWGWDGPRVPPPLSGSSSRLRPSRLPIRRIVVQIKATEKDNLIIP